MQRLLVYSIYRKSYGLIRESSRLFANVSSLFAKVLRYIAKVAPVFAIVTLLFSNLKFLYANVLCVFATDTRYVFKVLLAKVIRFIMKLFIYLGIYLGMMKFLNKFFLMTSIDFKNVFESPASSFTSISCLNTLLRSSRANVSRFETRLQDWENSTNFG